MQHVTRIPIVAMVAVARGLLGVLVECARRRLTSDVAPIVKIGFGDPQRPSSRQTPMTHSSVAIATMLTWSGTRPNVSRCVVAFARPSAGLIPGKYFSTPKARNTAPERDTQQRDAVRHELVVHDVLDEQQADS